MTPSILPGKMLQRYSVRLRIYSWFMKYCHPKLAPAGVITVFPVVTLVGANKYFWLRCLGRHRLKYIDKVMNKIEIGIRLLNRFNLALFSCLCWYENRVVYDRFRLAAKLSFWSWVTFEEDASSSRITSETTLGSQTSHCIVVSFSSYDPEDTTLLLYSVC